MPLFEIKKQMAELGEPFDIRIAELTSQLKEVEKQKKEALSGLQERYLKEMNEVLLSIENNTYSAQEGVSIRTLNDFEIEDESLLPDEFWKKVVDRDSIKEIMKKTKFTEKIPGVRAFTKKSIAVANK